MDLETTVLAMSELKPTVPVVTSEVYRVAKRPLRIHFVRPAVPTGADYPCVLFIQGCAFGAAGPQNLLQSAPQILYLVEQGFVVGSVEHTYSYEAPFPAAVQDVFEAVRYVKKHAQRLAVNCARIGVWGASSGGNLAAMIGTAGMLNEFPGNIEDEDPSVRAVVDWFGPTDFLRMNEQGSQQDHDSPDSPESRYIGAPIQQVPEKALKANPITYLKPGVDYPSFLIMHGDQDPLVPYGQSVLLYNALRQLGQDATLIRLVNEGHGTPGFSDERILRLIVDFFRRHLA
ncbi:alpha/beta hydrolase [Alicyclobacillus vulcanalis]|uniref:Acetyl esterase/lipase n=1 Tax=Alicyclobacillus vulcanalis TaxID=252246 RepID=A0A1N7PCE3_9BACL|nr:alpha/beta hydrolase [Alicyclobacillus vulcanalis]SIT08228.1 Acetyl esterase/lipase [Alicyclobacillus vulcanalis]